MTQIRNGFFSRQQGSTARTGGGYKLQSQRRTPSTRLDHAKSKINSRKSNILKNSETLPEHKIQETKETKVAAASHSEVTGTESKLEKVPTFQPLDEKLFIARPGHQAALPNPYTEMEVLPNGESIVLTTTAIQRVRLLNENNQCDVLAEKKGDYTSLMLHPSGYIVAPTTEKLIQILPVSLDSSGFFLGVIAQQYGMTPQGILRVLAREPSGSATEDRLVLSYWDIKNKMREPLEIPMPEQPGFKNCLMSDGTLIGSNGDIGIGLYSKEMDHSIKNDPVRELNWPNRGYEFAITDIGNHYLRFSVAQSAFCHIWDTNDNIVIPLAMRDSEVTFLRSLSDEKTFLIGRRNPSHSSDLFMVHRDHKILLPTGITHVSVTSSSQLVNGDVRLAYSDEQGAFWVRDFHIPYFQYRLEQICAILKDHQWKIKEPDEVKEKSAVFPTRVVGEISSFLGLGIFKEAPPVRSRITSLSSLDTEVVSEVKRGPV